MNETNWYNRNKNDGYTINFKINKIVNEWREQQWLREKEYTCHNCKQLKLIIHDTINL